MSELNQINTSEFRLTVEQLAYSYGQKQALKGISFQIEAGKFCALLGPNGAGKSTLFSLLTRLLIAPQGKINLAGYNLEKNPRKALSKLGVVFQQPTLDLDLTVLQNLKYFASLHGLHGKTARLAIEEALERLNMLERAKEKVRALNGGHRRRMEIARALIHKPQVLLLDEPTVGLDAASRKAITDHVHDLAARDSLTVLWATHLVDEVWSDDRLIILHQGEIIRDGICSDVTGQKTLAATFQAFTQSEAA